MSALVSLALLFCILTRFMSFFVAVLSEINDDR